MVCIFTRIYLYSPVSPPPTPRHTIFTNITRFYARVLNIWCVRRAPVGVNVSPLLVCSFSWRFAYISYCIVVYYFSSKEHRRRRFVTGTTIPPHPVPRDNGSSIIIKRFACLSRCGTRTERKRYKRVTIVVRQRNNGLTAVTCDNRKFNTIRYPTVQGRPVRRIGRIRHGGVPGD